MLQALMDKFANGDGGNGKIDEGPVELYREDSAYQTLQQRKDIIKAVVDAEGATGAM